MAGQSSSVSLEPGPILVVDHSLAGCGVSWLVLTTAERAYAASEEDNKKPIEAIRDRFVKIDLLR